MAPWSGGRSPTPRRLQRSASADPAIGARPANGMLPLVSTRQRRAVSRCRETCDARRRRLTQRRAMIALVLMLSSVLLAAACSERGEDTAAICAQHDRLRASGAVLDTRERWRAAGEGHPHADPR